MYIYIYIFNITARRCVLPARFKWRFFCIILQHAQTPAQGQCFEISQKTNLNPKTLNHPKP